MDLLSLYYAVLPAVGTLGVLGNLVSLCVFARRGFLKRDFTKLLIALAMADTAYLVFGAFFYRYETYFESAGPESSLFMLAFHVGRVGLTASVCVTVCICAERYLAVCWPFFRRGAGVTTTLLAATVVLSLLDNVPRMATLALRQTDHSGRLLLVRDFTDSWWMYKVEKVADLVLLDLLPLVGLPVMSLLIVRRVAASRRFRRAAAGGEEDNKGGGGTTLMLMTVVALFLLFHTLRMTVELLECARVEGVLGEGSLLFWMSENEKPLTLAGNLLLVLNSSCNVLVYAWRDPKFRAAVREITWNKVPCAGSAGRNCEDVEGGATAMTTTKA